MPRVRTRFAPSPTGYLHIGGARTALFAWLYARRMGGDFILRIEDTDRARSSEQSVRDLLRDLRWLGLDWDEGPGPDDRSSVGPCGPYFQSQRLDIYAKYLDILKAQGRAYPSFETKEELEALKAAALREGRAWTWQAGSGRGMPEAELQARLARGEKPAWRFRVPDEGQTEFEDLIHGKMRFENRLLGDFIIVRSDGVPTYNFAATVDDALMGITHVIRGDDHLSNTPRQICLYQALGFDPPAFAHIPMILGPDRQRLSKRHGATAVGEYERSGFLPEALLNYLALLGWSLDDKTTLLSVEDLKRHFGLERVSKHAAVFDPVKLEWMNGQYVRRADPRRLAELMWPHFERAGLVQPEERESRRAWFQRLALAVREKVRTLAELPEQCAFFFAREVEPTREALQRFFAEGEPNWLEALAAELGDFQAAALESQVRDFCARRGLKFKTAVAVLRSALSGRTVTPGIFDTMELLGREACLARLRAARSWTPKAAEEPA